MQTINKVIAPLLILLLVVALTFVLRTTLLTYLIEPIAALLWIAWQIVSSIDQQIYWALLITLCAILVFGLIPIRKQKPSKSAYTYANASQSRLEFWRSALKDAPRGKNEREFLRDNLKNLFIAVVSQSERSELFEHEGGLEEGDLLSPAARRYLFSPTGEHRKTPIEFFNPGLFAQKVNLAAYPEYVLIDEIIKFIEDKYEIGAAEEIGAQMETNNDT